MGVYVVQNDVLDWGTRRPALCGKRHRGEDVARGTKTMPKTVRTKTAMGTGLVDKTLLDTGFHSFLILSTVFLVELRRHRVGRRVWIRVT